MFSEAVFLFGTEVSAGSDFFAGAATAGGVGGGAVGVPAITGGTAVGFAAATAAGGGGGVVAGAVGAGVDVAGVFAAVARTGLGGKFNLGSFSKGAEVAPSSGLGAGGLVFICF